MAIKDRESLAPQLGASALWPAVASQCNAWLGDVGVLPRDATVLVPFAALLPLARSAFASLGGWQPRVETTSTLAASLAPEAHCAPGALGADDLLNKIRASQLLTELPWFSTLAQADRSGFDLSVNWLVDTTKTLIDAASLRPPRQRAAFWSLVQANLPRAAGPALIEAAVLKKAVEWAQLGGAERSNSLFDHEPSALIVLRLGGSDALADALADALSDRDRCPVLCLDADSPVLLPFDALAATHCAAQTSFLTCDSFAGEARATASIVINAINAGQRPVALAALDRSLIRRVRALLHEQGVVVSDETGWRLSTLPAAALVMAALKASAPNASGDHKLDFLKCAAVTSEDAAWVSDLEAIWRGRRGISDVRRLAAEDHWAAFAARLEGLTNAGSASLAKWIELLRVALGPALGSQPETAWNPVLRALRMAEHDPAWLEGSTQLTLDLPGFTAWADAALDAANHEPASPVDPDVVITPLARAIGRPFAHLVVPGADARSLSALAHADTVIPVNMAECLRLDTPAELNARRALVLAQLLRAPRLTFIRRKFDAGAPLSPSPLVQWMQSALAQHHGAEAGLERVWIDTLDQVAPAPVQRPAPRAAMALPQVLSPTQIDALRSCPYQFFARSVLRLKADDELDLPASKRDYGNWLHAVLHHFHSQAHRAGDDAATLSESAHRISQELHLGQDTLLPFLASFEALKPAYLKWLHAREAAGWMWSEGETDRKASPPELAPQSLRGRLDRVDIDPNGELELLDYKTTHVGKLKEKTKPPLEDTQLMIYAALLQGEVKPGGRLAAKYLALDDAEAPTEIGHDDALESVDAVLQGLGEDFRALRDNAAMPALGEGDVCQTCEMRGLCRKDHWARGAPEGAA